MEAHRDMLIQDATNQNHINQKVIEKYNRQIDELARVQTAYYEAVLSMSFFVISGIVALTGLVVMLKYALGRHRTH